MKHSSLGNESCNESFIGNCRQMARKNLNTRALPAFISPGTWRSFSNPSSKAPGMSSHKSFIV